MPNTLRVSDFYKLKYKQGELPFVDVDIFSDTPLFVDPRAIRLLPTEWGNECVTLLQSFFHTVISEIKNGRDQEAKSLLNGLHEPNETHLGVSCKKAQGRGMGGELSNDVWEMLSYSRAAKSGLLTDLEDAALMVEGIDRDIISDIAINIIREPLIRFTQQVCKEYGIALEPGVNSGPIWDKAANLTKDVMGSLEREFGTKFKPMPMYGCTFYEMESVPGGTVVVLKEAQPTMRSETQCGQCFGYCHEGVFTLRLSAGGYLNFCPCMNQNGVNALSLWREGKLAESLKFFSQVFDEAKPINSFQTFLERNKLCYKEGGQE